jgi:hypothetical protein
MRFMKAASSNGALSSGELAELAEVSRDTLRHYDASDEKVKGRDQVRL